MRNRLLELYDLIRRNNPLDWDAINSLLNEVHGDFDDAAFDIFYETLAQSCHWENYYRDWC